MARDETAQALIARLELQPHPEGGWYRQTWRGEDGRGEDGPDGRASGTAIHFLLEAHQRSHWHKVDAAEIWLWHAGCPVSLSIAPGENGPVVEHRLGPDVLGEEAPQVLVPTGHWQAAAPIDGWALVSCVVVPGFSFDGFELATAGWTPGKA